MLQHGMIVRSNEDVFGYYGWGMVARLDSAALGMMA